MVGGTNRLVAMVTMVAVLTAGLAVAPLTGVESAAANQPGPPVRVSEGSPCVDVIVLGARGSGQLPSDHDGLGPEVHLGLMGYHRHMGGYSIGYYPIPYQAAAVSNLYTPGKQKNFFSSIDQGIQATLQFLQKRQSRCARSNEHYVLAGYSQGAMVMHRVINRLNDRSKPTYHSWGYRILPRIDGVLAIADGDRAGTQGGVVYDTARTAGAGVSWAGAALGVSVGSDRPARSIPNTSQWPANRFHSVCAVGDIVCDFTTASGRKDFDYQVPLAIKRGAELHGNYYKPGGESDVFVRSAAANIAKTSKSLNPPEPLATVSMRVGQTDQLVLIDDGQFIDTVQWVGAPVPGAILSPGEPTMPATMTWKPTAVAVYPYTIRVRYDNGTLQDITGTVRAVAVPPKSIAFTQLSATYYAGGAGPYPQGWNYIMTEFTLTKTSTSSVTPTRIMEREDPASSWFIYVSGDANGNGILESSESWRYHGVMAWHDFMTGDSLPRTLLISANDRSGADEWLEMARQVTYTR